MSLGALPEFGSTIIYHCANTSLWVTWTMDWREFVPKVRPCGSWHMKQDRLSLWNSPPRTENDAVRRPYVSKITKNLVDAINVTRFSSIPHCSNSELLIIRTSEKNFLTLRTYSKLFWRTRLIEAQFQIEAIDPYPLNKQRTDLGMLVVLSIVSSVT